MNQVLFMWISIIAISILGTLAHFVYEFAHHNKTVGIFAAVNESTWEHIKYCTRIGDGTTHIDVVWGGFGERGAGKYGII
ncbi:hypothetical protein IJG22_03470 [Candidatus Saccharibacteria bacterium]|nr:hypothetical protein [Candidatus Saccharibacteria bacterium]